MTQAQLIAKLTIRQTRFPRKYTCFTWTDTVVHELLRHPSSADTPPEAKFEGVVLSKHNSNLYRDTSSFDPRACTPQTLWIGDGASFRSSVPSLAGLLLVLPVAYPTVPGQPRTCTYIGLETT